VVIDEERKTVSTPAYMTETTLVELRAGLKGMVDQVLTWAQSGEQSEAFAQLDGWQLDGRSISKTWNFEGDQAPLAWVNRVWELAQTHQHHPDVTLGYGAVTIKLTTHDKGGLSAADFKLAGAIDSLA
jgi:4a-hydroxytetrahydrobiopterin dehydratase